METIFVWNTIGLYGLLWFGMDVWIYMDISLFHF